MKYFQEKTGGKHEMKKKIVSMLLVAAMVASMAVGCGSKNDSGSSDTKSDKGESITFMAPDWAIPSDDQLDEFTKETGIEVEVSEVGWDDIREKMQTEMESFGDEKDNGAGQSMLEKIKAENRERHDYRQFLKKFAVLKEEQQIDADAFDYGFYAYGLSLYGNMPLIEPLETKEVKKVEEFIIAIDTSMSCSGELVKHFLEETWSILRETDSFFHTVNIHIIQCDEAVRKDDKIISKEELEEYMKNLEIEGKGGTDFVPVFTYVQELLRRKEFSNLRGLLYFTDGKGRFPKKMPPYQTAFVLVQKEFEEVEVPPWAIRIYQTEEDGYGLGEKKDEH